MTDRPSTHDQLARLNALLDEALALPAEARARWLSELPPEHQPLRERLTRLLSRGDVETDHFLHQPLSVRLEDLPSLVALPDAPGDVIGPYRLLSRLGAGGMASVWLASRSDGLLLRQVALKLPHEGWALGLAQRMARERDILASLEHPHIARLYDAGVTEQGRPWLAMELVSGVNIDTHCEQLALDLHARLRLFLQVLDAVAHAHARLVVHRDLKPSNILVTPAGEVSLLDFGVATLLHDDGPAATSVTQALGRAITPDYASPEHLAGRSVTVAADVYSLGVVLYELLTGQRPYRLQRQSTAALEEAILSSDRPLASQRAPGRALARQLRGDLDAILDKALRMDPAQRYSSVDALAAELRRYLDGEPVLAQGQSRRYRALKFISRHRWPLAAALAVTLSVVSGLGVALWQADLARSEARRAQQAKDFMATILKQAGPRQGEGGAVLASDLLALAGSRIDAELSSDPAAAAELGVVVGHGLSALGVPERGEATLRAAVTRAMQTLGPRHPITVHGRALWAESLYRHHPDQAAQVAQALVPDALAGLPATAVDASAALRSLAIDHARQRRTEAAVAASRQAAEVAEQHLGPLHRETVLSLLILAGTYADQGTPAQQLDTARLALERAQAAFGLLRPSDTLAKAERAYGAALRRNDRPADAVPLLRRALNDLRALDAVDTDRVRVAAYQLALALAECGQLAEAQVLLSDVLAAANRQLLAENDFRRQYSDGLAQVTGEARRTREALSLRDQVARMVQGFGPQDDDARLLVLLRRGRLWAYQGELAQAEADVRDGLAQADAQRPRHYLEAHVNATLLARLQGRPADALALGGPAWAHALRGTVRPATQAALAAELGAAWLDRGDAAQAEPLVRQALALFERGQLQVSPPAATAWIAQARLHLLAGRAAEAERVLLPLRQAWQAVNPDSPWQGETLHWLAQAVARQGRSAEARALRQQARSLLAPSPLPALRQLNRLSGG